jgi:hypothetical protein
VGGIVKEISALRQGRQCTSRCALEKDAFAGVKQADRPSRLPHCTHCSNNKETSRPPKYPIVPVKQGNNVTESLRCAHIRLQRLPRTWARNRPVRLPARPQREGQCMHPQSARVSTQRTAFAETAFRRLRKAQAKVPLSGLLRRCPK